jgi:hypothetical protein
MQVSMTDGTLLQVRSASIGPTDGAQLSLGRPLRLALAVHDTVLLSTEGSPS